MLPTVSSTAQASVSVLRGSFLTNASIVARILGASLAICDSDTVRLIANQIDIFLPYHQPTDAANETTVYLRVFVDNIITGDPSNE